jgi:cob(I)alamin adenosyltransferase
MMREVGDGPGLVQVYTGDGKGKTTAALGLALRAVGHGYRVLIVQFMKTGEPYGESRSFHHLPGLELRSFARSCLINADHPEPEDFRFAEEALQFVKERTMSREYDMVILDEVSIAVKWGLIDPKRVVDLVKERPEGVEMVLTGRYAPQEFLDVADLITEMRNVRHPYQRGVLSRQGIDR